MRFMLRALRQRPLLVNTAEVLAAAVRYVAIMIGLFVLLSYVARIAVGAS
jgi:hypothetical protein